MIQLSLEVLLNSWHYQKRACLVSVPGSPSPAQLGSPDGFFRGYGDSRCFWPGLEQRPVDLAELPTHRDMEQVLLRRARFPIGQQAQWDWVPLESKRGAVQGTGLPGVHLQMCFLPWLGEAPC